MNFSLYFWSYFIPKLVNGWMPRVFPQGTRGLKPQANLQENLLTHSSRCSF